MSSSGFGMVGFLNKLIALNLIELLNILINYVGFGFRFGLGSAIFGDVYTIGDGLGNVQLEMGWECYFWGAFT
jgi:hypothetical protein